MFKPGIHDYKELKLSHVLSFSYQQGGCHSWSGDRSPPAAAPPPAPHLAPHLLLPQAQISERGRQWNKVYNKVSELERIFWHPWNKHVFLRRVWLVPSGRTPRPHRADPPAETPVSVQCWGTGPIPGCSTAPWGTTCPMPGRQVAVPSTQGGVTCPLLSGTNPLPSSMTMNTDTLYNYSQSAW